MNQNKKTKILLNALTVRRSKEEQLVTISIEDLHIPDWMHSAEDPIFQGLYRKFVTGKIAAYTTRFPINLIKPGFYLVKNNYEYCCDSPPEPLVDEFKQGIRGGDRPPLHLYPNPNPNTQKTFPFLCPDDVLIYRAYKELGISCVPTIVLSVGSYDLPYSVMEVRAQKGLEILEPRIQRLISAKKATKLPTLTGKDLPNEPAEILTVLVHNLEKTITRIRQFHLSTPAEIHYHHMVFSAALRMKETLVAIEILIEKNLWYQALSLLRVLYEIHLNYYFDWLQPQTNYKFLAAAAAMDSATINRLKQRTSLELMAKGINKNLAERGANMVWRPVTYASTISEKSKLPMIGIIYHANIYQFLSQVSHQDFEVASLHANRFDNELFSTVEDDAKITYLRFMDLIVSEFFYCINEDIGLPSISP